MFNVLIYFYKRKKKKIKIGIQIIKIPLQPQMHV